MKHIIAISGINAVDNPGPGVAVARSLREFYGDDIHIIGLAYDAMEPGIYMDWLIDESFLMPYPSGGSEALVQRLLTIKKERGLDMVIPNLDAELPIYIANADRLREAGIQCYLPDMKQFRLRGKDQIPQIAKSINIETPETVVITNHSDLHLAAAKTGFPFMLKGAFYGAQKVQSIAEALQVYHHIVAEWGFPLIAQRMVTGEHLNCVAVGNGAGGHLGMVAIKKLSITKAGKIWTGVTIHHPQLLEAAQQFTERYQWKGPFEMECLLGPDNKLYLIEINPRFPAWVYFATGVGCNLPQRLVTSMDGCEINMAGTVPEYQSGKLFVRYTNDIVTDMSDLQSIVTSGSTLLHKQGA